MVDKAIALHRFTVVDGLLQRIKHKAGMGGSADPPPEPVEGQRCIGRRHRSRRPHKQSPCCDVGDPKGGEANSDTHNRLGAGAWILRQAQEAVDLIERAWRSPVAHRRAHRLATDHACQAKLTHQPFDCAAGDTEPFTVQLPPYLADTPSTAC
jgi:hypothetical protein